jgi:predicted Zn finger-like uncharacterized protein
MSLATRCTECGTVFRVVQDQLKVSEGWVRCGRCSAVFNALENLCDIDSGDSPDVSAPASRHVASAAAAAAATDPHDPHLESHADGSDDAFEYPSSESLNDLDDYVSPGVPESDAYEDEPDMHSPYLEPSHAKSGEHSATMPFDDDDGAIVTFSSESPADPATGVAAAAGMAPAFATAAAEPAPQFVKAAEREAFWRRTPVRASLLATIVLLGGLLVLQVGLANRDVLAAHVPGTRPVLASLCQAAGCRIQPLRRIDRLSVDSSGLARVEGAPLYKLSVVLHNRAETALLAPALDLSLTDAAGKLVARRVLQGADLGLPPVIEPGQELPLQALLSTGDKRITGYTVELFYP